MTNTFIPTLSRQPLYCVWIETGNPSRPLDRVWIDPELRSFVHMEIAAPVHETNHEFEAEAAEALPEKGPFAGRLSISPITREEMKLKAYSAMKRLSWAVVVLWFLLNITWADVAGRISGMVSDPSGASVAGATVTLSNVGNGTKQTAITNDQGQYSFPVVPVGRYELEVNSAGFQPYKNIGVVIDVNSALQINATLQIGQNTQTVDVNDSVVTIQMSDTEIGETISSEHVAEVPLNGRSYTDLLATQAGVSPVTTSGAANSSSGGGFGTVPVAGNENTGQFSINGQRESANGFFLNGASVQESIGQQAGIIPNLDSIAEFRIISSNADAEYGGYSGGLINVVTKSGGDQFHGSVFEFLRNTNVDARGYFSPERSTFQQNQFGGTFGGPIKKGKIFFFGDYQGQRTVEGIETGLVSVPSLLNRTGNFSDSAGSLTGKVNGTSLAQTLSSRLGYLVNNGESFYAPGCTSNTQCVFPNAIIPQQAFGLPATKMLQFIPSPNVGGNQFSSGAEKRRTNDDKGSARIDANTTKYGNFSAYYFIDRYNLDDPYPVGFGGATVPGPSGAYDALSDGTDQVIVLRDTKTLGATMVNEAHFSYTRLNNTLGVPKGGVGISLADQGISSGPQGIQQGFPQYAGVETLYFNSFTTGTNPFFLAQVNNTYQMADNISKVVGNHTLKIGGQYLWYKVKQLPDLVANGTFSFFGSGTQSTGNGFADFLLGLPDFYSQQSSPTFYESAADGGIFAQDSWRIKTNLTLNYGMRWDYVTPWAEMHHQTTTLIPGVESQTFPSAPLGYLVPGDHLPNGQAIPAGIAPTPKDNFSPRIGLAYSPNWTNGFLSKLTGGPGKTSIHFGAGRFFTSPEGLTVAYPTGNPPYGLTYTSPEPPLMSTPFTGALTGTQYIQQFPVNVPPYNVSPKNPDTNVNWNRYTPISGAGSVWYQNKTPYTMSLNFSVERQIGSNMLVSASYIGSESRHLLTVVGANPGIPSLCLALSQPQDVAPGSPTCGPFLENNVFTRADGTVVNGTRGPFPNTIGTDAWYKNVGNANYNALQFTLKRTTGPLTLLASYTYGKSLDQSSSIQEQVYPYNYHEEYAPSAFDIKQNFVVSYNYELPFAKLSGKANRLTDGWSLSGITRFASGLPVTFASFGDNALVYVQNNGVNSVSIDLPNYTPGNLEINHNPRNGLPYFNASLFTPNAFGTQGNAKRRFFYGPGINNFDVALRKNTKLTETKSLEFRLETFNTFNHAQFYPNGSVDGNINSPTFGHVLKAAPPRIGQIAVKFTF
jgi:Carboxypeptidase regulatory-like domain